MVSKLAVAASVASLVAALPQAPSTDTPTGFGLIAVHSGDPKIHLREVNANQFGLWLGKPTTSFCPTVTGLDCNDYPGNATVLAAQTIPGTAYLDDFVPGGQQLYQNTDGAIGYTTAHSQNIPKGAVVSPFEYKAPTSENGLGTFTGPATWLACPSGEDGDVPLYQIYGVVAHNPALQDCTPIVFSAIPINGTAWEYI